MATILHIEDDPQSRLLVRKLLQRAGHEVLEAVSGVDGTRLAMQARPDLILLDINVPDLDGYEVAMLLRERLAEVPIVAVTAEGDRATALGLGCRGFVAKPIEVRTFVRTIETFLASKVTDVGTIPSETTSEALLRAQGARVAARLEAKVHELSDAHERLIEADRLRREFYRNVSHELATPLTPLVGYLGLLSRGELGALTEPQRKAVRSMDGALGRLRRTIDNLLDVTQLETGRLRFTFAPYDLREVVLRSVELRRPALAAQGAKLFAAIPDASLPALGDADRIFRAVEHLLDNAEKFGPPGGAVGVELRFSATHAELLVADEGVGVPPGWLARIFEPFVQVDGSPTRKHGGAGIGLAVVRGVAEAHGGGVVAETGSRMRVAGRTFPGLLVRLQISRRPEEP
ncbi:MAG: hybrid sensor histidine kinase/response regulator [Deltaproteobacteria bacterium]|nr:hybrid sensor histidine kinase/response regulator [Myxococcales bacterium]MDP3218851.1 hybrid sensor histidine kinase/response regulator [Deltaproteobacteria bacterium]